REKPLGPLHPGGTVLDEGRGRKLRPREQRLRALACPLDLRAAGVGIGETRGRKPVCELLEAFAPPLYAVPQALPRALGEQRDRLALAGDAGMQRLRCEPRGGVVEPLARQREQLLGARQRPHGGAQLGAACLLTTLPAGE